MQIAEVQRNHPAAVAFLRGGNGGRAMADKRALKLIGVLFGALTLTVVSTAAAVVAGHAENGISLDYRIDGPRGD